jgi:hypothetical protein
MRRKYPAVDEELYYRIVCIYLIMKKYNIDIFRVALLHFRCSKIAAMGVGLDNTTTLPLARVVRS